MKRLFAILILCLFAGCGISYKKAIEDAFNECKSVCAKADAQQINTVCFEKDKKGPICMCFKGQ